VRAKSLSESNVSGSRLWRRIQEKARSKRDPLPQNCKPKQYVYIYTPRWDLVGGNGSYTMNKLSPKELNSPSDQKPITTHDYNDLSGK